MRRKRGTKPTLSDEEIMEYRSVPVTVAASYLGTSTCTIHYALQQQRAPYGYAVLNAETGTWTYHISPGGLVRYRRGELPAVMSVERIIEMAADGVQRVLDLRSRRAADMLLGGEAEQP